MASFEVLMQLLRDRTTFLTEIENEKQLKVLAVLLEKVRQYNNLVKNLKLVTELNLLKRDRANSKQHAIEPKLEQALALTRNSLLNSIELEKIINRDRQLANNRYHLLTNLESGSQEFKFINST